MSSRDIITLADLKAYVPIVGTGRDAVLDRFISAASRTIETDLGRRIVYRAPAEVEGAANIVASVAIANGALSIAAQPSSDGRTLIVTVTDANRSLTAGLLTVTGTVGGVAGVVRTFDLTVSAHHGLDFFSAISAAVISGAQGQDAADTIKVGSSIGYVDYHTPDCTSELPSLEWPVRTVNELNEDSGRAFGASTKLSGTGYLVKRASNGDWLVRLSSNQPIPWVGGWRSVKQVYSAGYSVANVPEDIKDVCRRLVAILYQEVDKGRIGLSGGADATGNWQRFARAALAAEMRQQLDVYRRSRFGSDTAERDYDLEAA